MTATESRPVVLQQHRENLFEAEIATRGVPEDVTAAHAWRMVIFDGQKRKEWNVVSGTAAYQAPGPGTKGYGRLTFTISPEVVSGELWGIADYAVEQQAAENGPWRVRFGGPVSLKWNPPNPTPAT